MKQARMVQVSSKIVLFDNTQVTDKCIEHHIDAIAWDNFYLYQLGYITGHPYTHLACYKLDEPDEQGREREVFKNAVDLVKEQGDDCDGWSAFLCGWYRARGRNARPMIYQTRTTTKHAVVFVEGELPNYTKGPMDLAVRAIIKGGFCKDSLEGTIQRIDGIVKDGFVEDPARAMGMAYVGEMLKKGEKRNTIYRDAINRIRNIQRSNKGKI